MTDYTELKRLAEAAQYENCEFQHELVAATKAFFVGCIPEQILALIAENERLNTECKQLILLECHGGTAQAAINLLAERDQLKAENEALREEVALDDKIIADRDHLLNMFECPEHGQCIPFAMEQVEALRKDAERLQSATDFVQKLCDAAGNQPSVATGYLHDILSVMGKGAQS